MNVQRGRNWNINSKNNSNDFKMKKIIYVLAFMLLVLPVMSMAQSFNFVVKCKINSPKSSAKAYLLLEKAGEIFSDSTDVVDGSFTFSAVSKGMNAIAYLKIVPTDSEKTAESSNFTQFYTDAKLIKVLSHGTLDQSEISGGSLNRDQAVLNSALRKGGVDRRAVYTAFIKSHPQSYVSLNALFNISDAFVDANELDQLFNSLSLNLRSTKEAKDYASALEALKKIMVGSIAPDFTMPDTAGRPVSLHDFKGKYVLLDFWASWCTYCREESPYLVKAYAQYQKKGFTILGVSLDNLAAKNKWIKAIRDDRLTWTQVSDLKTENEAALLYSVVSIPHNFLINPEGKIIARNLRGKALKEKLQELFDN